jgi:hypothetical protein
VFCTSCFDYKNLKNKNKSKSKKDEEICPNVNCKASNYVVKEKGKRKGKKGKKKEKKVKVKFAKKLAPFAVQ